MKNVFNKAKWAAAAVTGIFGAATMLPVRTPVENKSTANVQEHAQALRQQEAIHTTFGAASSMLPIAAGGACAGPLKPEIREACIKAPQTPVGVLAQNSGELMQAGRDVGGVSLGILQAVYPGYKKKLAELQAQKIQPK